ncbi:MAG: glucan biosynthesis protein G [Tateyamaria sp.]|uniref:glucan biosynthesis protein n=1 Tax=Tateyamaria sp. TaxID=1929288 RepID=UPI00329B71CF
MVLGIIIPRGRDMLALDKQGGAVCDSLVGRKKGFEMAENSRIALNRRHMLAGLMAGVALPEHVLAQSTAPQSSPFSFETLDAKMRAHAATPYAAAQPLTQGIGELTYDDYRNIYFRPNQARWNAEGLPFQVSPFHPGWLYNEPVLLNEIVDGQVQPLVFVKTDFEYRNNVGDKVDEDAHLMELAGLKLVYPLNHADKYDEVTTFLGASYFRALGKGNSYGLSARGMAIDTWLDGPEEFPRFTEFWLERPEPDATELVVFAALDSPSVTGAYRFVITPGDDTVMDVTASLHFRSDVRQIGLGALTSMFYFAEYSERDFDDFRMQVHDSDALRILRKDGDVVWRPLNNPTRVANSFFVENNVEQFGLVQRDRTYEDYADAGARYHDRPSVMIEPLGDWGAGAIRLVEIPADLEIDDNIVLFWVPDAAPKAGETRQYSYRMHWGALPPKADSVLAWVAATRAGVGGPSGVPITNPNLRKFVVDFQAGDLGQMEENADLIPVVTHSAGKLQGVVLHKVSAADEPTWRLFIDIDGTDAPLIEITAHVADATRKLSEIWAYQWVRTPES